MEHEVLKKITEFTECNECLFVVHPLQASIKRLTMLNPSIKVFNGGVYTAVGCIEHGEFAFEISTGCKHGKQDF